jgi:hypothetical protein
MCMKQKTVQSIQAEERGFSSVDHKRFYLLLNRAIFAAFPPVFPIRFCGGDHNLLEDAPVHTSVHP